MPRKPRLFIPEATYHVYCRVARGEFVFDDDFEAIEFIEILRKVRDLDGWTILAWCLMGNHFHLVLKTRNVDLSALLSKHKATVTRWLNAGLQREGEDRGFRQRLDELDRAISHARNHATMRNVAP